jgi:F0F1-type ATP synthase assembly protein I
MKDRYRKNKNKFDSFIRYSSLAFEMMGMIGIGTFLGYKIDQAMDNNFKWFTLFLMVFSVIGTVIYTIRKLLK